MTSSQLFSPITIRGVTFPNRVVVSPLCMYSAQDGLPQPFHFSHLSTFARGGAGLVFTEATAITPEGRITPNCLGIWDQQRSNALKQITEFISSMESVPGIQLAHAGRKGSTLPPFDGGKPLSADHADAWQVVGPTTTPVADGFCIPTALSAQHINDVVQHFADAAERALDAGFRVIEIHGAHGYLIHSFLSPLTNTRNDEYGGSIENRMRLALDVTKAVRQRIGEDVPLFFRVSAIDNVDSGWNMDDTIVLCHALAEAGVDIVDCSSGGVSGAPRFRAADDGKPLSMNTPKSGAREQGFQVPFAERVKAETDVGSMAVGVIINPEHAESIVSSGQADFVALGRELMYNPFWPQHAAEALGANANYQLWPKQYAWGVDRRGAILAK
ncbi:MAG: NADH:flavin oxidoreductase/NADH oxidase [Gammaproteobacteria bacterium]|nr:NADH:flavin oxidoreductase/NADH oxidase [Gammaproteobacteria bacterium]